MEENRKQFNRYIFLSTLARSLIDVFIGTVLFKSGFSIKDVILYYLFVNIISFIITFPCVSIARKYSNKVLIILGIIFFSLLQVSLSFIRLNILYLIIVAFLYAGYRRCYWASRRYYTLQVIDKNNISKEYSFISIASQIASIIASYLGAVLLEYVSINVITLISIFLLLISIFCISKIHIPNNNKKRTTSLIKTLRITPISSMIHIGCYELQNVLTFLLPLYIIIYVRNTYTAVGIINLSAQLATIIFLYGYGVLIDKNRNYLKFSIIFLLIFKLLQVETSSILLFTVTFISGLATKMYEQSFHKELVILSKNYDFNTFNLMYETIQNVFRIIVVLIFYFFISDVKIMIYITIGTIAVSLLFKFKTNIKKTNN